VQTELLVFVGICMAVSASPGPAVLYIVARTLDQGTAAGLASMAGITVGGVGLVLLAAFGVAAAAAAWPLSLLLVQIGGALYLVWLGWQRASRSGSRADAADSMSGSHRTVFLNGVIVNLTNPKSILFLLAFLPQFVDPLGAPLSRQLLQLGLIFVLVAAGTDAAYVLAAGRIRRRLAGDAVPAWSGYLAGAVYAALGMLGLLDAIRQIIERIT
jgi:threonine/homoserine/homoserine lactone efflux protein